MQAGGEEVIISLTATNPQAIKNKIRFDHRTGEFVDIKVKGKIIKHLNIASTCIHKHSDEGRRQLLQIEEVLQEGKVIIY